VAKQNQPSSQKKRRVAKRDPKLTRYYLDRVLSLSPVTSAQTMVEMRWRFCGLNSKASEPAVLMMDIGERRNRIRHQLEEIRSGFWLVNAPQLRQSLDSLKVDDLPELKAGVDRLKLLSLHREDFGSLATHKHREINLYNTFRRMVMLPPRKAGGLKERYLRSLAQAPNLKRVHQMVKMMRKEYPELFEIESDWFSQILKIKSRYVDEKSSGGGGFDFDIGIPSWMYVVTVILIVRILAAMLRFSS